MKYTLTLALAILLLAATGRGQTTNEIHLGCYPLNPIVGQAYRFGNDPNTHTYMGGNCWNSTLLHWSEDRPREKRLDDLIIGTSPPPVAVVGDLTITTNAPGDYSSRITLTDKGIRKLAASGEICRVLGFHCWGIDWESAVQLMYYPDGQPQSRKCRICGKVETYKGEWE